MRNILVLPDGTEQDFMYPSNRIIQEGEKLSIQRIDGSTKMIVIRSIEKKEHAIYYFTEYVAS